MLFQNEDVSLKLDVLRYEFPADGGQYDSDDRNWLVMRGTYTEDGLIIKDTNSCLLTYELRDIKEDKPSREELVEWYQKSGLPLKRFFNTSGLQYKALGLKDKLPTMSEEEQLDLLATDGMLVKRPIAVGEDFVLVGFKEAEWIEQIQK